MRPGCSSERRYRYGVSKPIQDIEPLAGYPADYAILLAMLQDGTRDWRDEIGEVTEDELVWQPHPGAHSIGGVILHMVDVEGWWIEEAVLGRERSVEETQELLSEETQQYKGLWPTPPRKPLSYYYELQDRVRERTIESVRAFGPVTDTVTGTPWEKAYTLRWVLNHVVAHESYHAGQAVLLKSLYKALTA
jgi:uncharacterized damage-inducible protein DinB